MMEFKSLKVILKNVLGIQFDQARYDYIIEKLRSNGWDESELSELGICQVLLKRTGKKFEQLVDLFTVHETYFFREYNQLEIFANTILNTYSKQKADKSIRILSAGCSSGEEAYTLGIILKECLDHYSDFFVEIVGVDVSLPCIQKAQKAIFSTRSVKFIPEIYKKKYFIQDSNFNLLDKTLLPNTKFIQGSLMDQSFLDSLGKFDFIFCRNVLIYFDQLERAKILALFKKGLYPQGRLFLGHSESLLRQSEMFESVDNFDMPIYVRTA